MEPKFTLLDPALIPTSDFIPKHFIVTREKAMDMFAWYIARLIRSNGCPAHCKEVAQQPFKSCQNCESFNDERRLIMCWFLVAFLDTPPKTSELSARCEIDVFNLRNKTDDEKEPA